MSRVKPVHHEKALQAHIQCPLCKLAMAHEHTFGGAHAQLFST